METITINIDEYNLLKEQNKKLRVDSNEYVKVKELYFQANEENDKLKEEMDELKAENTELMKEQYKLLDEKESLSTTFWTKNEELKEDIERLKGKATAWKIINAGTDWENIAQICDEEMARELVKTGEVNWMDFDFLIWPENEEE